jgi:predicted permease
VVTALVTYLGAPCLVFSSLVNISVTPATLADMGLATVSALAGFAVLGALSLRVLRLSPNTHLPPLVFGNTGNMGLPLCVFAFGDIGLELGVVFFSISIIVMMTLGIWLVSGTASPMPALKTTMPYAVAAAAAFLAGDTPPPAWLYNTVDLLGDLTIPLMLVTLGVSLARMKVVRIGRTTALALLRLGMGFVAGVGLAEWFGLAGAARGVFIIQCTMPVAVFTYLFAHLYRREPDEVARSLSG